MTRIGSRGTHGDAKPESGPWRVVQRFDDGRFALTRIVFARGSSGMAYMALTRVKLVSQEQAEKILAEDNYWKNRRRRG